VGGETTVVQDAVVVGDLDGDGKPEVGIHFVQQTYEWSDGGLGFSHVPWSIIAVYRVEGARLGLWSWLVDEGRRDVNLYRLVGIERGLLLLEVQDRDAEDRPTARRARLRARDGELEEVP
jgi:hypothetical protein